MGFGAPGGRDLVIPITLDIDVYNSLFYRTSRDDFEFFVFQIQLECGPMPNVMVALPNIGGALCSTPQFG